MRQNALIAACSALACALAVPAPTVLAGSMQSQSTTTLHTYRKSSAMEVINAIPINSNKVLPLLPDEYEFLPAAAVGIGGPDQAVIVMANFRGSDPQIDDDQPGTADQFTTDLAILIQEPERAATAGLDIPGANHVYTLAIYTNDAPYATSLQEADFPAVFVPEMVYDRQIDDLTGAGDLTVVVPADDSPFYSLNTAFGYAPAGAFNPILWHNGSHGTAALHFVIDATEQGDAMSQIYTQQGSSLNDLLEGGGFGPGPVDPDTGFESVLAPSLNFRYRDGTFGRLLLFVPEPSNLALAGLGLLGLLARIRPPRRLARTEPIRERRQFRQRMFADRNRWKAIRDRKHRRPSAPSVAQHSLPSCDPSAAACSKTKQPAVTDILNFPARALQIAVAFVPPVGLAVSAQADIYQWEYINPADPSQGKRQSTKLAPDGAGVDAVPGADLSNRNLTMAYLIGADLTDANGYQANLIDGDLSQANLTNADFGSATLTGVDFTDAEVRAAHFSIHTVYGLGTGISLAQLYSTASYRAGDLSGIDLIYNDLSDGNFAGHNLANAAFDAATATAANFNNANLTKASFGGATMTDADFIYANLTESYFYRAELTDVNFSHAILKSADFLAATLTGADFTGADICGAVFDTNAYRGGGANPWGTTVTGFDHPIGSGITFPQLFSTSSYHAHDLSGIDFTGNNFAGGNFAGQSLSHANLGAANLTGANLRHVNLSNADLVVYTSGIFGGTPVPAALNEADLTGADTRGTDLFKTLVFRGGSVFVGAGAIVTNAIRPDGHISGLDLHPTDLLVVRDYDGKPNEIPASIPIAITIDEHLSMAPGGTLRLVFEADGWDSTISFAPGIPVTLGGTLELAFADDVNLASQLGRTLKIFDWTGVNPTGAFAIASPYAWDTSQLYTTGEVRLISVPELSCLTLAAAGAIRLTLNRRRRIP